MLKDGEFIDESISGSFGSAVDVDAIASCRLTTGPTEIVFP
jgi:hypothetical protein